MFRIFPRASQVSLDNITAHLYANIKKVAVKDAKLSFASNEPLGTSSPYYVSIMDTIFALYRNGLKHCLLESVPDDFASNLTLTLFL
jgi:hypothetical protein